MRKYLMAVIAVIIFIAALTAYKEFTGNHKAAKVRPAVVCGAQPKP